jgi:hypothetical protein
MRRGRVALAGSLLAALAGCAADPDGAAVAAEPGNGCPPAHAGGNAAIDRVPFVRVGGLMFHATFSPAVSVEESALGPTVATVRCRIADVVHNPDFRARDGDAAFLPAGTGLRAVTGYRRDFRLAAREDGGWHVYEVFDVPDAATGRDQLDLAGQVRRVHLVDGDADDAIRRTVHDPEESPWFVRFDLTDGTVVQRAWHVRAGVLVPRIAAPAALAPPAG